MQKINGTTPQLAEDIGESRPQNEVPAAPPDDSSGPGWRLMCFRRSTKEETMSPQTDRGWAQNSPGYAAMIAGHKD